MRRFGHLVRDTRGAVAVEYTILVGTVAVASLLAFVALGTALANDFRFVRGNLMLPFP